MGASEDEFPVLPALGLYAAPIRGDGNCLFNALSDQLYGSPEKHNMIRAMTVDYMRVHGQYYKQFIEVHAGGGVRRNPKRKNAGAFSTPVFASNPSNADIERVFESHLLTMAKGGVYGDNMEISAFSCAFNVDVKIYQREFAYMVCGPSSEDPSGEKRKICHIAYHQTWEHYSSIRNLNGPHTGLPEVNPRTLTPDEELEQRAKLAKAPRVLPWQIDMVHSSLPYYLDRASIKRTIEECKGDINRATERLLEVDDRRSPASSAQDSSSVEREQDSDDEAMNIPNKKRDRRRSRAVNGTVDMKPRILTLKLNTTNDSLESLVKASSNPPTAILKTEPSGVESADETEDDEWRTEPLKDGSTSSGSEYSDSEAKPSQTDPNTTPSQSASETNIVKTKLKQTGPRRKTVSSRQMKDIKKMAQKAAAKERRQIAAGVKKAQPPHATASNNMTQSTLSFPTISSGIRTLYI